jgi:hypothetical protein
MPLFNQFVSSTVGGFIVLALAGLVSEAGVAGGAGAGFQACSRATHTARHPNPGTLASSPKSPPVTQVGAWWNTG